MIPTGPNVCVYAATKPTDMRKSFNTLAYLVKADLGRDPMSGELFLFMNARRTRAKVLYYDGTGLVILMKRLEKLRFAAPWRHGPQEPVQMSMTELQLFLEGSSFVFVGRLSPDLVDPGYIVSEPLTVG